MSSKYWRLMPKSDRRGFVALAFILLLGGGGVYCFLQSSPESSSLSGADSLSLVSFQVKQKKFEERRTQSRYKAYEQEAKTYPFDPNKCDSATFVELGLKPWMAHNAIKYRQKGGRWRSPDDFQRLYGLSRKDFERLRPYIRISSEITQRKRHYDSIKASYPQKFQHLVVLDLNMVDTIQLKRIPGIGSYYASKICRYRERLGGFVSIRQINEVEGLPDDVEKWFFVASNPSIHTLNINKSSFKQLVRHPYLNYEQVKDIVTYIRKFGPLKSWRDLSLSEHFTQEDFKRLQPYFVF